MTEGRHHTVRGRVTTREISNQGLRVELLAPDRAELFDCAFTDETGAFTLSAPDELLTTLFGDQHPHFFFRVFLDQRPLADTRDTLEWSVADGSADVRIDATRPLRDPDLRPTPYVVRGRLTDKAGRPLSGHTVEALDKNLRPKETRIGRAETGRDGAFSIRYQPDDLGRPGKPKADLVLEVVQSDRVRHHLWGPRCRADTTLLLSLSLGGREVTPAYDRLMAKVEPALGDVPLGRLDEDDTEYLACSLGLEQQDVEELVAAHRFAPDLRVDADVAWALLHAGLPSELEALLERGRAAWRAAIDDALDSDDIAPRDERAITALLDALTSAAVEHIASSERARFATLMRTARDPSGRELVGEQARQAVVDAWMRHEGSPDALWDELQRGELAEVVPHVRRTLQLSAMADDHLPLVAAVQKRLSEDGLASLRDLATWTRDDWQALIASKDEDGEPVGVPAGIPGDDEKARRAGYAERMVRQVEEAFPTRVLAHRVASDEPLADEDLVAFFDENPDLELKETRLGDWLAERPDALERAADPNKLERRLRGVERLVRVTPRQEVLRAVMAENLSSATELHSMGKTRLRKALARRGGSDRPTAEMAESVWHDICWHATAAQALHGKLHPNLRGPRVYAIAGVERTSTKGTVADLEALFGSVATCACEHCRSVFGPAAYLVDLLQFLHRYDAKQLKMETLKPGPFVELGTEVSDALVQAISSNEARMERLTTSLPERARLTIGEASLSLDTLAQSPSEFLVGHVEDEVAKDQEVQKTLHDMSEIAREILEKVPSSPLLDFRSKTARDILLSRRRDIGHLKLTCDNTDTLVPYIDLVNEALEHRLAGKPLASPLMTSGTAEERAVVPEIINESVHRTAYEVLAERVFPWSLPFHLWERETRAWLGHLGTSRAALIDALPQVATLADDIRRARLLDELGTSPAAAAALESAQPWRMWGFDEAQEPSGWVQRLRLVAELMRRAVMTYEDLVELLTTAYVAGDEALEVVPLHADEPLTCDPAKLHVPALSATALDRIHRFERTRRALGWTIADLDRAIALLGTASTMDGELLERLATVEELRARVKRPVEELLTWWGPLDVVARGGEDRSGYARVFMDPRLAKIDPALAWDDAQTKIQGEGLSVADHQPGVLAAIGASADDLRLLIDDEACLAVLGRPAPVPGATISLETLTALYRHVQSARALRLRVPELLRLLAVSGLDPFDDQNLDSALALAELAARLRARSASIAELDHLVRGVPAADDDLDATRLADLLVEIEAELDGLLDEVANADPKAQGPTPEAVRLRGVEAVVARLASALRLDERLVRVLATTIVRDGGEPVIEHFVARLEPNGAAADEQTRAQTVRRLRDAGMMAALVRISPDELAGLQRLGGWVDDDGMPLSIASPSSPTESRFTGYERLDRLMRAREGLRGGGETLLALMSMAAGTLGPDGAPLGEGATAMTEAELFDQVADRTGWARQDVADLVAAFGFTHPASWTNGTAIPALVDAFEQLRRVGVSAADAMTWTNPTPDLTAWQTIATQARAAARARYDTKAWTEAARPVQDGLRAEQRDALVAALLQDGRHESTTDLYDALLLDVQMDPCRMTSRIKQAISATQLFIQRCFLNLEPNVQLDEDAAREWTWRKNYRVWEANRKDLLFPEKWIQGRLRDDKTPLFGELEQHLLQGELTNERAEEAVYGYIDGLGQLSHLEVLTVLERAVPSRGNELHLFAKGADQSVWHRVRETSRRWKAWEKVPFDVEGKLLMACVTPTRQIRALWVNELEGEYDGDDNVARWAELRLAWSDLTHAGWTPVRSSVDQKIVGFPDEPKKRGRWFVQTWGSVIQVVFHTIFPLQFADNSSQISEFIGIENGGFHFAHAGVSPVAWWKSTTHLSWWVLPVYRHTKLANQFTWENGGQVEHDAGATERAFQPPMGEAANRVTMLSATPHGKVRVVADPAVARVDAAPFVFQDDRHAFVVSAVPWRGQIVLAGSGAGGAGSSASDVRFEMLHHPLADAFARHAYTHGVHDLYRWDGASSIQLRSQAEKTFFENDYGPNASVVAKPHPVIDVDFSWRGACSPYNWELFFHVPFFVGEQLTQRRRFEDAMRWFQYIFDPTTGSDAAAPARFWKVRPFYEAALSDDGEMPSGVGVDSESGQIQAWEDDPFNPHLVARMQPVAYQKAVVMKYLDNLVAWADQLFRRYSIESLNEATQLYLLASKILGPRPTQIEPRVLPEDKTYLELADRLDAFSNALVEIETYVPPRPRGWTCKGGHALTLPTMPYFCTPPNEQLLAYWDKIDDRLFKIRHCMDIEGRVRQLPLFEAPIDPGMLVRARAAGVDIGEVLAGLSSPRPSRRFEVMLRRAQDLVSDVRQLGSSLLSALEKRDAEQLAQLRQTHELTTLRQVRQERKLAIEEARESLAGLQKARAQAQLRQDFYENRERWLGVETAAEVMAATGGGAETGAGVLHSIAAGVAVIPQAHATVPPATELGGNQASGAVSAAAHALSAGASAARLALGALEREAMRTRREEDWDHAAAVAAEEGAQLDKQVAAAELRIAIAEQQLESHDLSVRQSREVGDFLRSKFTDDDLYDWMIGELSAVYFQLYELAYEGARMAEAAFRFELGLETSDYISFGYWSDLHKGLLAGDKLALDLRRLEMAHVERDARELELSRSVSLVLHDPAALMDLKTTGTCTFDIPEELFDADYPGHYFRRIRNVTLTIPCVAGPHTPINCRLSLDKSALRVDPTKAEPYPDQAPNPDTRFRRDLVPGSRIATSTARNDAGVFEVSFSGPRYLPFEGAGTDSTWTIALPRATNGFDFDSITDVVLRLDYTARDGGEPLASAAHQHLETKRGSSGHLQRMISLRHELPDAWEQLVRPGDPSEPCELVLTAEHFPFIFRARADDLVVDRVDVAASRSLDAENTAAPELVLTPPSGSDATLVLSPIQGTGFSRGTASLSDPRATDRWTLTPSNPGELAADELRDLWLIFHYRVDGAG